MLALLLAVSGCFQRLEPGAVSQPGDPIELLEAGQLKTCTHLPYPPFQSTENDEIVGFDVDVVDEVAKRIGANQVIFDTSFEGIETGQSFEIGDCDVAAAGMTITPERERVMDFSDPYFDALQSLLVRTGSDISSLADLRGKTLGVQQGTTGEEYATREQQKNGYRTIQFEDLALLQTAVLTGRVEAGINDNGVLYDYAKDNPKTTVSAEFDTGDRYGIAVRKGNGALLAKINEVLAQIEADGTYDQLYLKWFGRKPDSSDERER
nr:transporter substrate-binding domain-containing protein [Tamaricihabitans halophyticus]